MFSTSILRHQIDSNLLQLDDFFHHMLRFMATFDDHLSKISLISNSLLDDLPLDEDDEFMPENLHKELSSTHPNNSFDNDDIQKFSSANLCKDSESISDYHTFGVKHQSTKKILEPNNFTYSNFRPPEENMDSQQTIKPVENGWTPGIFEEFKRHNKEYMKVVAQSASTYNSLQENLKIFFTELSQKQSATESQRSTGTPIKYKEKIEKLRLRLDEVLEENSKLKALKMLYETKTQELNDARIKADAHQLSSKLSNSRIVCSNCSFYIQENERLTHDFGKQISELNVELTLSNNRSNKLEYEMKLTKLEVERLRKKLAKKDGVLAKENRHPDGDTAFLEIHQNELQPYSKTMEWQRADFIFSPMKSLQTPLQVQKLHTEESNQLNPSIKNLYDYLYRESEDDSISKVPHQDFEEFPGSFRATKSEAKTFKFENSNHEEKQSTSRFKPSKNFQRKVLDSNEINHLSDSESIDGQPCPKTEASHFTVFAEQDDFSDEQEFYNSSARQVIFDGKKFPRKSEDEFSIAEIQSPTDSLSNPDIIITLSDNFLEENRETELQDRMSNIIKNNNLVSAAHDLKIDTTRMFFKQPKSVGQLLRVSSDHRFSLSENFTSFAKDSKLQ